MPISGSSGIGGIGRSFSIDRVRSSSRKAKADGVSGTGKQAPDGVALSTEAKALLSVRSAPDIRTDKVEALKQAIADGTYEVSRRELARRLLDAGVV